MKKVILGVALAAMLVVGALATAPALQARERVAQMLWSDGPSKMHQMCQMLWSDGPSKVHQTCQMLWSD